jgi:nicotinamide mononucleotide transporter
LSTLPEILAVALGLAYLLLAIRERRSCWLAGGLASLMFLGIFWRAGLFMQSVLQLFYVGMAIHGWLHWGADRDSKRLRLSRSDLRAHLALLIALALLSLITLQLRAGFEDAQAILDTVTSWGGVLATWMVAQKKVEAWLYWIVIDAATVVLYFDADLLASSALYALYTILAFVGWKQWLSTYRKNSENNCS